MSAELGFSASLLMSDECHVLVVTQGWIAISFLRVELFSRE